MLYVATLDELNDRQLTDRPTAAAVAAAESLLRDFYNSITAVESATYEAWKLKTTNKQRSNQRKRSSITVPRVHAVLSCYFSSTTSWALS